MHDAVAAAAAAAIPLALAARPPAGDSSLPGRPIPMWFLSRRRPTEVISGIVAEGMAKDMAAGVVGTSPGRRHIAGPWVARRTPHADMHHIGQPVPRRSTDCPQRA